MKVLSLFSGVGGFDMGLEAAGMETVFQCEWDKNANQILKRHWPDVPKWDDVSTLTGKHILEHAPVVDVVAWGSPCQDLSVAGKRAGLEGERSGLFHEGIRIIKELRKETNNEYPRISIWENVAGALSSNRGADFGVILNEMAEAGAMVIEWAMLDAQHFGIPQRRRRVFLIAIFDPAIATNCPSPLLPVSESLRGDIKKGKPKRKSASSETATGFGSDGQWAAGTSKDGDFLTTSVTSKWHKGSGGPSGSEHYNMVVEGAILGSDIVGSLNTSDAKMISTQYVNENKCIVEPYVKSRRAQSVTDDETWVEGEVNPTLNSFDVGDTRATTAIVEQPVLFENSYRDGARIAEDGVSQTLTGKMGTGGGNTPMLAFDTQFGSNANVFEDQSPTLKASQQSPSVAYPIDTRNALRDPEKHDAQNRQGLGVGNDGDPSSTVTSAFIPAVAYSIREDAKANTFSATELDHANALSALRPSPQSHHAQMFIAQPMAVRRLTPLECERLMGWPDDHTRFKADGIEQADTHRYKQCGNGVASPVAAWIGKQIMRIPNAKR